MLKKILSSFLIVGITSIVALRLTGAFFNDTETSKNNTLQAGALDLKIDNSSYYNGTLNPNTSWTLNDLTNQLFFNFNDIKPNDYGGDTISLHAENNYWACMQINSSKNDDNTCTTPELLDDPTCNEPDSDLNDGELGQTLNFLWWADDGDNVLETGENVFKSGTALSLFNNSVWPIADSSTNIYGIPGPLPALTPKYIGKAWCFGTLTASALTPGGYAGPNTDNDGVNGAGKPEDGGFKCDGTALNNASQTDSLMGDITFKAYQARNNNTFLCSPAISPTPTPIACVPGFATGVVASAQGIRKDGSTIVDPNRTDPTRALGAPQTAGLPDDNPVPLPSFFSLGFGAGNIGGGNIVLSFANPIVNLAGFDFRVFEVTGGTYPDEKVKVEASQDGTNFFLVTASASRDAYLDLTPSGLSWASQLRLTDVSDKSLVGFPADADAYDLDAVQTFCGTQVQ